MSFFLSVCTKCGCVKEKTAVRYPCKIIYQMDGKVFDRAPECGERFIVKQSELDFENVDIF